MEAIFWDLIVLLLKLLLYENVSRTEYVIMNN